MNILSIEKGLIMNVKSLIFIFLIFFLFSCTTVSVKYNKNELFAYATKLVKIGASDEALKYYKKVLKMNGLTDREKARVYNNIAVIYEKKGDLITAKKYYVKAIKLSKESEIYKNYRYFVGIGVFK